MVKPRRLLLGLAAFGVWACLVSWGTRYSPPPSYRAADLVKSYYHGRLGPKLVVVLLDFPLRPTDDPLVFEYRPSEFGHLPPSIRFRFRSRPPGPRCRTVVGVPVRFDFDLRRRVGGLPGVVVMDGCAGL